MPILTQGLSSARTKGLFIDWREVVWNRFRADYEAVPTSKNTAIAENGLRIAPEHAYWLISKVDTLYGRVLMVWRGDPYRLPATGIVAPFDSGGLWLDHMYAATGSSVPDKYAYLQAWSMPAHQSEDLLREWLVNVFVDSYEYVDGSAVPDWVIHDDVKIEEGNSLAWSWEFRCPKGDAACDGMRLDSIFWARSDLESFRSYVRTRVSPTDVYQVSNHLAAISRIDKTVSLSMQHARQYVAHLTRDLYYAE